MPFIELQSVDSTNNYARQQIHEACLPDRQCLAQHGTAWFAHEQTAGKGQRGKIWESEKDTNIALSIIVKPDLLMLRLARQFQLSACTAVAVHDLFRKYAGEDTKIKWPNDLYWQDRKAGGILIESVIRSSGSGDGDWEWAIIGIGINVNQVSFSPFLSNPVSLKQITGQDFNTVTLAKEICNSLQKRFTELNESGFDDIYRYYNEHLYKLHSKVKFKKQNRVFEAIVKRITSAGRLVVEHSIEEEFDFGEVEWII